MDHDGRTLAFTDPAARFVDFSLSSPLAPALLLDGGGLVEAASPAALADLGLGPDVLVGLPIEHVLGVAVSDLPATTGSLQSCPSGPDGASVRWRACSLQGTRVDGGWLVEFQLVGAASPDTGLAARSAQLERLFDDLTERFEALNRYLGLISHDLQAPTRRLLLLIELLEDDLAKGVSHAERITAIRDGADHLLALTTKLLQFARLGKQPMLVGVVDAQAELETALTQLSVVIDEAGLRVEIERPLPNVIASETFLSSVFQNLIENAIAYRRPESVPRITFTWEAADDSVRIDVTDDGVGIADEHRGEIFEPFHRFGTGEHGKTGTGLATVRDIVERFGGGIVVSRSEIGVGSTFTVTLPAP